MKEERTAVAPHASKKRSFDAAFKLKVVACAESTILIDK